MMELTNKDTKMIQGLCVLAMVWLHLFDTRNYEGLFKPVLFFCGRPLTLYIAQLSDFCVMGFAFCSGYAHYRIFKKDDYYKNRLRLLFKLCIKYWTILITFAVISTLVGKQEYMPNSWKKFLLHFFFLDSGYNGAWWYLSVYIVIVLVSPILLKVIEEKPFYQICLIGTVLYFLSYCYRFRVSNHNLILSKIGPLGMTLAEYMMGVIAAKYRYFTFVTKIWKKIFKQARIILSILAILAMLLIRTLLIPSLFVAPITGMAMITLFHLWDKPAFIEMFFLEMGNHSSHIWLTHMFFYLYLFPGLVYKAIYPLPIYIFMIMMTLVFSVVLNCIENNIYSLLKL